MNFHHRISCNFLSEHIANENNDTNKGKWDITEIVGMEVKLEGNVTLTPYICNIPIQVRPPPNRITRVPLVMS
jgi:hypothetical protein